MQQKFFGFLTFSLVFASCGLSKEEKDSELYSFTFGKSQNVSCAFVKDAEAKGVYWDPQTNSCVNQEEYFGPFTQKMREDCYLYSTEKNEETKNICFKGNSWSKSFASEIKGLSLCPQGSSYDIKYAHCVEKGEELYAIGPFSQNTIASCKKKIEQLGESFLCENTDKIPLRYLLKPENEKFCPSQYQYDSALNLCVNDFNEALGPFSQKMIQSCKNNDGGEKECEGITWDKNFVLFLKGNSPCPEGSSFDEYKKVCREESSVFGPFTKEQVENCLKSGGDWICLTNRVHESFIPDVIPRPTVTPTPTDLTLKAHQYLYENYSDVRKRMLAWFVPLIGDARNTCAATQSQNLREIGLPITKKDYIAVRVLELSPYLQDRFGWKKYNNYLKLEKGDLVISSGGLHIMMFDSWANNDKTKAYLIDNNGKYHAEWVRGSNSKAYYRFSYFIRP